MPRPAKVVFVQMKRRLLAHGQMRKSHACTHEALDFLVSIGIRGLPSRMGID